MTKIATCSCVEGYALEAKKTCKAIGENATLLIANENALRSIYPYVYTKMVDLHAGHKGSGKISSLEVMFTDHATSYAFWSAPAERVIYYQNQRNSSDVGMLLQNITQPRGLSADWLSRNLYYISDTSAIAVVRIFSKTLHRILIPDGILEDPIDLVVDPFSGRLFIADRGMNPKIFKANLDGTGLRPLIEAKIAWPSSLAIDYPNARLYWSDLKARTIDSVGLDAKLRKSIRKFHVKEGRPDKIDVFENYVYFTSFQHNKIYKLNKFGRGNISEIAEEVTRIGDIVMTHVAKYKAYKTSSDQVNPCENNGPCDGHMPNSFCVIHPLSNGEITAKCICTQGYEDVDKNGTCVNILR